MSEGKRGALDSRDGEGAKKIRACKKGILRWCVICRFLKSVSLLLKFALSLTFLCEIGRSNKRGHHVLERFLVLLDDSIVPCTAKT